MNPLRSRAGNEGCTVITVGVLPSSITGAKSLNTSNGSSLRKAGSVTSVLETITRVWPSAGARATSSAPSMPEAPGRFSTTTVWPSAGPSSLLTARASTSSVPPAGNGTMKCSCLLGNGESAGAWAKAGPESNARQPAAKTSFNDMNWSCFVFQRDDFYSNQSSRSTSSLEHDLFPKTGTHFSGSCSAGDRRVAALHLHAVAGAHVGPVVPDRLVVRAAVIPERDRMRGPAETAGPLRLVAMIDQEPQHTLAFKPRQFVDVGGEVLIDEDHLPAGHRMTRDDGVHRNRRAGPEHAGAVMGRGQAREILLHPVRKCIIGRIHARKQGIAAAVGRNRMIIEHGAQWRDRRAGLVAVKIFSRNLLRALVVMELAHVEVIGGLADGRLADMLAEPTKIAGNADLVLEADFLVAEEEDLIPRERVVQLLDLLVAERSCQVDGADLGADMGARVRGGDGFIGHASGNRGDFSNLRQMRGCAHGLLPTRCARWTFGAGPILRSGRANSHRNAEQPAHEGPLNRMPLLSALAEIPRPRSRKSASIGS